MKRPPAAVEGTDAERPVEGSSTQAALSLDMPVTSSAAWAWLGGFGVLIVGVVAFSIVGRIPERVDGSGILLSASGVRAIEVKAEGVVESVHVELGDPVKAGDVVAELELAPLKSEIRVTRDRVDGLAADYARQSAARQRLGESLDDQIANLIDRRRRVAELVKQGIRTPNELRKIDKEISGLRSEKHQLASEDANQEQRLASERRKLVRLQERLAVESIVRSSYDGKVAAVLKPVGQRVRAGEKLINLEDPEAPLRAFVFLPFAQGQKVKVGDEVRVRPTTVKASEYGHILATVEEKSAQPVTFEEVRNLLQNEELAKKYVRDTPYRVLVRLHEDPACPGGLDWTAACGPEEPIQGNTPCEAQVIVKRKRPIQYVIPLRADDRRRAVAG